VLRKRSFFKSIEIYLLIFVLLSADIPKAKAQTSSSDEDATRIKEIVGWLSSAFDYAGKLKAGLDFITGVQPPQEVTLQQIEEAIEGKAFEESDRASIAHVKSLAGQLGGVQTAIKNTCKDKCKSIDDIAGSPFAQDVIANSLSGITSGSRDELENLGSLLESPRDPDRVTDRLLDQRAARVMAAYSTVVGVWTSSMKLIGDLAPELKSTQDELISEELVQVQQTLFVATGAYLLHAYECNKTPVFFYSPVGGSVLWLSSHRVYKYYNYGPPARERGFPPPEFFWQYENEEAANVALTTLESVGKNTHAPVWADNVPVWDLQENIVRPCVVGWVERVRSK
jgi:hypothetical protein